MAILSIRDISKSFQTGKGGSGSIPALDRVSINVDRGAVLCLLGPSGCGKTTLLRVIAGLEKPDTGTIRFQDQDLSGVPPYMRRFGMMFQDYALFPHKNVFENIAYGLRVEKWKKKDIGIRVRDMLSLVGLTGFAERTIQELSGGERQRVALARSLAPRPRLLMLDEPLGSLDRELRESLLPEIISILKSVGVTAIFVTHDHGEAFAAADIIAVFRNGRIVQVASPEKLYQLPADAGVARFLGFRNFIDGKMEPDGHVMTCIGKIRPGHLAGNPETTGILMIRPEAGRVIGKHEGLQYHSGSDDSASIVFRGTVTERSFLGRFYRIGVRIRSGQTLFFEPESTHRSPNPGDRVRLQLNLKDTILYPSSP